MPKTLALPLPYEASIAPTQTTPMLAQTCQPNLLFSKTVESAAVGNGTMLRSNWFIESEMKTSDQLLRPMFSAYGYACVRIQITAHTECMSRGRQCICDGDWNCQCEARRRHTPRRAP